MLLQFREMNTTPKTARGRATRERIVNAAAALIRERGVAETSLDDVIGRAGVSKSQLYLYFEDRAALLREVVVHNTELVLVAQEPHLDSLDSWKAIRSWLDALVQLQVAGRGRSGCPIGSLVGQLAETDAVARKALADSFTRWEEPLRRGLCTMQNRGKLNRRADPGRLATATLASIQGGLVLTQSRRDPGQLAVAVDAAYAYLRLYAA
jgi:TetR/AcrR family transcriptional regulator, transcriptional repressor for nem operon